MSAATTFRALHERDGAFVMPNPWNVGSTRLLESLGFEALATTSSGHAYSMGRADGVRAVSRDEALQHAAELSAATPLPINGDLERGYGDTPEEVAETIKLAAAAGLAGGSIEDSTGDSANPIYDLGLATERIEAAVEAARGIPTDFVLTARAENFLHDRPHLDDTVRRLQAFQEAGADVLYAPGIADIDTMRQLVAAVDRPVNALARPHWTVGELEEVGVKRISIGGALAVASFAALLRGAREILDEGTFTYVREIPDGFDLDDLFSAP
ncbi:MAG: isocitrate lyase/phosphoenolpyruvate mutase family protein [bacterium]|nr:isocitrate lyase/phosphoenolpyruvate mutase family protein [bacterium]